MKIFLLILIFFIPHSFTSVIQAQIISRHCDRTVSHDNYLYLEKFKETTDVRKILDVEIGMITPLGERQCYILGSDLRNRYLNNTSDKNIINILPYYDPKDYFFLSSGLDRTLISGYAVALGLFPLGKGKIIDYGKYKGEKCYPNGEQAVAYISETKQNCIFFGYENCDQTLRNIDVHQKKFREYFKKNIKDIKLIEDVTGNIMKDIEEFKYLYNLMLVLRDHGSLPNEVEAVWDVISKHWKEIYYMLYNRDTLGYLGGGLMTERIVNHMKLLLPKEEGKNNDLVEWKKRIVHFSAHDETLSSLFAALDIQDSYDILKYDPAYGSAFIFELHQEGTDKNENKYHVEMVFKESYDGKYTPIKLKDCEYKCEFKKFVEIMVKSSMTANWCGECGIHSLSESCVIVNLENLLYQSRMNVTVLVVLMVLMFLFIGISLILYIVIKRRRKKSGYKSINDE